MLYKQIFQPCNGGEKKERADPETAVGVLSFHKNSQIALIMSVNCEHN